MKLIISFLCISMSIFGATKSFAQDHKITTDSIKVAGNCGECKERIEDAAYIKGVKEAHWDKNSHWLVLSYRNDKTSLDKIKSSILAAGHDLDSVKASDKAYEKLPKCCLYRSHVCNE